MTTACGAAGPPLDQLAYPEPGFPSLQPAVVVWELPRSSSTSWAGRRSGGRGTILSRGAFWVAKQPVVRDYDLGQAARDRATGGRKDKPRHSLLPPESATLLWAAVSGRGGGQPTSPRSFLLCLLAAVGILFLWGVPAGRNASKRRHNPGAGMGAVIQVSPLLPASGSPSREQQLRIPRIVHQTYKVSEPSQAFFRWGVLGSLHRMANGTRTPVIFSLGES